MNYRYIKAYGRTWTPQQVHGLISRILEDHDLIFSRHGSRFGARIYGGPPCLISSAGGDSVWKALYGLLHDES